MTAESPKWLVVYSLVAGALSAAVSAWGVGHNIYAASLVAGLFSGLAFLGLMAIRIERIAGHTRTAAFKSSERAAVAQAMPLVYDKLDAPLPMSTLDEWTIELAGLLQLQRLIERETPGVIVEIGSGASTPVLAHLAGDNGGFFFSIENDASWVETTRGRLYGWDVDPDEVLHHVPLRDHSFKSSTPWYDTDWLDRIFGDRTIGLVFVDGPAARTGVHRRYPAFPYFAPKMASGGIIMLDDYHRDDEQEIVARWKEERPGIEVNTFTGHNKSMAIIRVP